MGGGRVALLGFALLGCALQAAGVESGTRVEKEMVRGSRSVQKQGGLLQEALLVSQSQVCQEGRRRDERLVNVMLG